MKSVLSAGGAVLVLLTLLGGARADLTPPEIVGSATSLGDGLYKYQYTFTNIGAGTYLQGFYLHAAPDLSPAQYSYYSDKYSSSPTAPFLNVTTSGGFAYNPPLYWATLEGPEGGLTLGQSVTVSFVAPFQPGAVPYTLQYYSPSQDESSLTSDFGTVTGPVDNVVTSAVNAPEPAASILLGLGVLSLAVGRRFLSASGRELALGRR